MNETCGIFRANWYCLKFAFFVQLAIGMAPDDNDDDDQCVEEIEMRESSVDDDMSDYIHINVTNEFGVDENVDNMWVVLCPNYWFASTMAEYEIKLFDMLLQSGASLSAACKQSSRRQCQPWQTWEKSMAETFEIDISSCRLVSLHRIYDHRGWENIASQTVVHRSLCHKK